MPHKPVHTDAAVFKDLNVTPFIDVLLVLLIMLIMTIPVLTHVTNIDLPSPVGGKEPNPTINVVGLTAQDRLLWNGEPVDRGTLQSSIVRARALPTEPVLRFSPDPMASYDASAKTIALIKDTGAKKFAFDRLYEHKSFGRTR